MFRNYYGPTHKAFAALDQVGQTAFAHDLLELARRYNTGRNGALRAPSAFLEAVAVKAG